MENLNNNKIYTVNYINDGKPMSRSFVNVKDRDNCFDYFKTMYPMINKADSHVYESFGLLEPGSNLEEYDKTIINKTVIISAYPCCGKTYAFENYKDAYKMADSDSSKFSWTESGDDRVRNPLFPNNYIEHISKLYESKEYDFIFVSSHEAVRNALANNGFKFVYVYPREEALNEWIGRMYLRGSDKQFIDFQIKNWNDFHSMKSKSIGGANVLLYKLYENQYLDKEILTNIQEVYLTAWF